MSIPTNPANNILGVVLAGGAGRRFAGQDKGLIDHQGRPLAEWVVKTLRPQVAEVVLCVHRNQDRYQEICAWLVADAASTFEGPLAGVTALAAYLNNTGRLVEFDYLALCACDTPNIPSDYVAKLHQAIEVKHAQVAIVHDGERRQNLHCLISTSALDSLCDFYAAGGRAMHRWFAEVNCTELDFSAHPSAFHNINSPSALEPKYS